MHVISRCIFPTSFLIPNHNHSTRPATLSSFAVMNFSGRSCNNFIETVVRVARSHGIEIPSILDERNERMLGYLTEHYRGGDPVDDALEVARRAVQKAKLFNCYDSAHWYRSKNVFFQTRCYRYGRMIANFLTRCSVSIVSLRFVFVGYLIPVSNRKSTNALSFHLQTRRSLQVFS